MGIIYSVTAHKGGVAKTTTAINLGAELARRGKKVLLVDMDAQSSLTKSLGYDDLPDEGMTLPEIMTMEISGQKYSTGDFCILHHMEGFDVLPSSKELAGVETDLDRMEDGKHVLSKCIRRLKPRYDYIILDCETGIGIMVINALITADNVIIPVETEKMSVDGLEDIIESIGMIKRNLNSRLGIAGVLFTKVRSSTKNSRWIMSQLEEAYGRDIRFFASRIPCSVRAAEAPAFGVSIFQYDPRGKVAEAYASFAEEVICHA